MEGFVSLEAADTSDDFLFDIVRSAFGAVAEEE